MANYTKATNFGAKDSLTTGDPNKVVKGSEFDTEYDAIATMSSTKEDKSNKNIANGYCPLDASSLVPLANIPTTLTGKSADLLDGYHAVDFPRKAEAATVSAAWTYTARPAFNGGTSGSTSPFTVDSTQVVTNLNADLLDGYNTGNASGNIPLSNGTVNTNLNADLVDGIHASSFLRVDTADSINAGVVTTHNGSLVMGSATGGSKGNGTINTASSIYYNGYRQDVYSGYVELTGIGTRLPTGWSSSKTGTGVYVITHNLGLSNIYDLLITASAFGSYIVRTNPDNVNSFTVRSINTGGSFSDSAFTFIAHRNT